MRSPLFPPLLLTVDLTSFAMGFVSVLLILDRHSGLGILAAVGCFGLRILGFRYRKLNQDAELWEISSSLNTVRRWYKSLFPRFSAVWKSEAPP